MNPSLAEILRGCLIAATTPPDPEAGAAYAAARASMTAMLLNLAMQEAERGAAAALAENAAIRALLALPEEADGDRSLSGLAAANARLRRALIAAHEVAEAAGDAALDAAIIALYRDMAAWRRLDLANG